MTQYTKSLLTRIRNNDPQLETLDLSDANIGDKEAGELAEVIQHNSSIIKLNLGFNQIGPEGAKKKRCQVTL